MKRHIATQHDDSSLPALDWQNKVHLSDKYPAHCEEFSTKLAKNRLICDGRLGHVSVAIHRTELGDEKTQPVYSATFQARTRSRVPKKIWVEKILLQKIIEPAPIEWAAPIVFPLYKAGTFWFCIDYRKRNVVGKRDLSPTLQMDECIGSVGEIAIFSPYTLIRDNELLNLTRQVGIKLPSLSIIDFTGLNVYGL